jgi:hypothetical protein
MRQVQIWPLWGRALYMCRFGNDFASFANKLRRCQYLNMVLLLFPCWSDQASWSWRCAFDSLQIRTSFKMVCYKFFCLSLSNIPYTLKAPCYRRPNVSQLIQIMLFVFTQASSWSEVVAIFPGHKRITFQGCHLTPPHARTAMCNDQ